jgi:hypothetical protein
VQNAVLCAEGDCQQAALDGRERVPFLVVTSLILPVLTYALRLFCGDILLQPATVWGYLAMISHLYLTTLHYGERLLLPLSKSWPVSLMVWVGGRLETQIYREEAGCIIAALTLIGVILLTGEAADRRCLFPVLDLMGVHCCLRRVALMEETLIYIEQVESIRQLRVRVREVETDDRPLLPGFLMWLLVGMVAVSLVGAIAPAPDTATPCNDFDRKTAYGKGCAILRSLTARAWSRLPIL